MLKEKLLKILDNINYAEQHNKQVMNECIQNRLDKSLNNYKDNLENTCKYILLRNPIKVLKSLADEEKAKENKNKTEEN